MTTHAPSIKVAGTDLSQSWLQGLTSLRVHRALGLVGRATLRFVDAGYALSSSSVFRLGTEVSIAQFNPAVVLLKGTVTGISLDQSGDRAPELVVTVDDGAAKLSRGTKTRTFLRTTYTQVVRQIASENGLQVGADAGGQVHEYLLQTGSDLAYLSHIAARTGAVWWVEESTLRLAKAGTSTGSVRLELGDDLVAFSVRASAQVPEKVKVTGWSDEQQQSLVGENTPRPGQESTFVAAYPGRSQSRPASGVLTAVNGRAPLNAQEATSMADALAADSRSSAVVARGTCPANAAVKPSVTVEVTGAGPASGSYLVTEVEHTYSEQGFVTRFTAGPHRPAGLVDVLGAPAGDPGFAMHGVVPAIVTNIADPDGVGRAKVKYPTISDQLESAWARIVTLGAGDKRGMVFQPEVNDEVLVAFEQGDTRRPVILGGLFSKRKGLPTKDNVANSEVAYRRITSRLGHVIELADGRTPATKHILLKLADGKGRVRVGSDRLDIESVRLPLKISNGQASITMDEQGNITMEGTKISIRASQDLTLEGLNVEAKANVKLAVQGTTVQVKANATGSVEAGGPLALKGAIVAIN